MSQIGNVFEGHSLRIHSFFCMLLPLNTLSCACLSLSQGHNQGFQFAGSFFLRDFSTPHQQVKCFGRFISYFHQRGSYIDKQKHRIEIVDLKNNRHFSQPLQHKFIVCLSLGIYFVLFCFVLSCYSKSKKKKNTIFEWGSYWLNCAFSLNIVC